MFRRSCAALMLLGVLAIAPSAHAASPGINLMGDIGDSAMIQAALDTGAREVRIFAMWPDYEPDHAGQFDPTAPPSQRAGITNATYRAIHQIKAAGRRVLLSVTNAPAWANGSDPAPETPPTAAHVGDFASFIARLLHHAAQAGDTVDKVEIWNEPDEQTFWNAPVDPARYTGILKAAYSAIKAPASGSPATEVFTGPTTGNNYAWIQALYDSGAKGSFDGVAVHTDNSCLVDMPDRVYRENGRVGRFVFLGVREVRATMLANGDDKPIAMSELGVSSTNGGPTSCTRGTFAGQKPNGVTAAFQAEFLTAAYRCLANEPYVTAADWFHLSDTSTSPADEMGHYGLQFPNGQHKPAYAPFKAVADANGGGGGECADFDVPSISVISPRPGQAFEEKIDLRASASDTGVGLARLSFFLDENADSISNVTDGLANGKAVGLLPWSGQYDLGSGKQPIPIGAHTIRVVALDKNGNTGSVDVPVIKVAPGMLPSTTTPILRLPRKVRCRDSRCRGVSIAGRLSPPGAARVAATVAKSTIDGKVAVEWQCKNKKGRWRKLIGGLKPANKPFTFRARPKKAGRWRVRVVYQGKAPYKRVASKYLTFRVR